MVVFLSDMRMRTANICSLIVCLLTNFDFKFSALWVFKLRVSPHLAILCAFCGMVEKNDEKDAEEKWKGPNLLIILATWMSQKLLCL